MNIPKEIQSEINNIERAIEQNDEKSVKIIDECIHKLSKTNDNRAIKPLLLLLDENFDFQEGMWSIMHFVESYPANAYVDATLNILTDLNIKSIDWADRIVARMLNSSAHKDVLISRYMFSDANAKDSFMKICNRINEENLGRFNGTIEIIKTKC